MVAATKEAVEAVAATKEAVEVEQQVEAGRRRALTWATTPHPATYETLPWIQPQPAVRAVSSSRCGQWHAAAAARLTAAEEAALHHTTWREAMQCRPWTEHSPATAAESVADADAADADGRRPGWWQLPYPGRDAVPSRARLHRRALLRR